MGAFLDKPVTDKHNESGRGNGLQYGLGSMQGWRQEMEDAHTAVTEIPGMKEWSFFAVFDGHNGDKVSAVSAEQLLNQIIDNDDFPKEKMKPGKETQTLVKAIERGIRTGFLNMDYKLKIMAEDTGDQSGSTAVGVIVSPEHIFFANCGDSRAVLSKAGKCSFATTDHKPLNPTEKERIEKAGGAVVMQRIDSQLAVSRAFGDFDYKTAKGMGPCEQKVSPEPEIFVVDRDTADEFLVLACDGIWDVMTNDQVCDFVRHRLQIDSSLESICNLVIDTCLHKESRDNMSVMIVKFDGAPEVNQEAVKQDEQLDIRIEAKIKDLLQQNEFAKAGIISIMDKLSESVEGLPAGGGVLSKYATVEAILDRLRPMKEDKEEEESEEQTEEATEEKIKPRKEPEKPVTPETQARRDWLQKYLARALGISNEPPPKRHLEDVTLEGIAKYIASDKCQKIVTMAGAGISTSAGIPDFRSPGTGMYANLEKYNLPDPQSVFSIDFFKFKKKKDSVIIGSRLDKECPEKFFELAKERDVLWSRVYKPTPCHYFLRLLSEKGKLLKHFTQNIDALERLAGLDSEIILEAHGNVRTSHCMKCQREYSQAWMKEKVFSDLVPKCLVENCDGVVKPDVVFYGESLPKSFGENTNLLEECDLLIILGTSLAVQPFASLTNRVKEDTPRLYINLEKAGNQSTHPLMAVLFGGGFDFDKDDNIRDVFWQGTCDDGCYALADFIGWGDELRHLVETEHAKLEKEIEEEKKSSKSSNKNAVLQDSADTSSHVQSKQTATAKSLAKTVTAQSGQANKCIKTQSKQTPVASKSNSTSVSRTASHDKTAASSSSKAGSVAKKSTVINPSKAKKH